MTSTTHSPHPGRTPFTNRLLVALTRADHLRIESFLEPVTLAFGEVLYEVGDAVRYVYFPTDSLVSLLTLVGSRHALEVGMVGPEGMVGTALALGVNASPFRVMVQGAGKAMRMEARPFLNEFHSGQSLQRQVHLCTHALLSQIAQTAACNRFHSIEERLARWLLMTRDRVGSDHFHITQEFLGNMLGVRRVGVTNAASALRSRALIDYHRGNIHIIDGPGLQGASCSCYEPLTDRRTQTRVDVVQRTDQPERRHYPRVHV